MRTRTPRWRQLRHRLDDSAEVLRAAHVVVCVALVDRIVANRSPGRPLPHPRTGRPTEFLLIHLGQRVSPNLLRDMLTRVVVLDPAADVGGRRADPVDGTRVPASGVVEDAALGGHEVAVDTARGACLGVSRLAYLLVRAADDASPSAVTAAIRAALPNQVLRIRTPGERPFARAGDEVLPQGPFKLMFGEFAVRRSGTGLVRDPAWAARNLMVADVPLLGRFRCDRRLVEILVPALQELDRLGLAATVDTTQFGGCYNVRAVRGASTLPTHAEGAAVDLNVGSNPLGGSPTIDRRIVDLFESRGLRWGGRFLRPDGQHF